MKFTWLIGLGLLLLSACGREIDPELQTYVDSFQSLGKLEVGHLIVKFGDLPGSQTGVCAKSFFKTPTVTIDRARFDRATRFQREKTVFHELGHCVLDLPHVPHVSIMYGETLEDAVYAPRRDELLQALFK